MAPDLDAFRALARSSPWRWRTLQLVVRWHGPLSVYSEPVRAWVHRPFGLRVEHLDGRLAVVDWSEPGPTGMHYGVDGAWPVVPVHPTDDGFPAPVRRPDGLVARRPPEEVEHTYDDPMFQSYQWVAMLAPLELADGSPLGRWPPTPEHVPVSLADGAAVRVVDNHGREAWEADLVPTDRYHPRCSCCPLLPGQASDAWEVAAGARPYEGTWADAHRVRLDVGTGIVVALEQLGGDHDGTGFDVQVESVDEPLPRSAFGR